MMCKRAVAAMLSASALFCAAEATAQNAAPSHSDAPAFAISGWRHSKAPEGIEMYECASACKEPARVSYRVYVHKPAPSLEEFQRERVALVGALKQRFPAGTRIELAKATRQKIGNANVLKSLRLTVPPGGRALHTLSGVIFGERSTVELISSSQTREAAEANFSLFLIPTLVIAGSGPNR